MGMALVIGFAFGFVLERAGLGNSRKLAGQFDFTDFTVMKVMMTAIAVAMAGVFIFGRAGVLTNVYVPETSLPYQIAGGAIFGFGFLIAGLCPGTSCVAAASGRTDGLAVIAGMLAGVLIAGLTLPAGQFRTVTVPQLLHIAYPIRYDIDAPTLAGWIKERKAVEIIDRRSPAEFAAIHIPRSINDPGNGSVIVRADGREYVLRGGAQAWVSEVLKTQHPTPTTSYFTPLRRHGC